MTTVPPIPDTAPFSTEQRAWLNGYLASLFGGGSPATPASAAATAVTLTVAFGSQTGNSEVCARTLTKAATSRGLKATMTELNDLSLADLQAGGNLLIVTSTYGDGEMPDTAASFWSRLSAADAPALPDLHYSVLALGDSDYAGTFCQAGREIDERLAALGATPFQARVDCDVDFDDLFESWSTTCLDYLGAGTGPTAAEAGAGGPSLRPATTPVASSLPSLSTPIFSRKNPFPAHLIDNRCLNGEGSAKETRHVSISLAGSDLQYEVGDALGIMPSNCPELVDETLQALQASGYEPVPSPAGHLVPLREALLRHFEISAPPKGLLSAMASRVGVAEPQQLINGAAPNGLESYLAGRQVVDLLTEFPDARPELTTFVESLRPLTPRLYSISSSHRAHPGEVHLTVGIVRYESHGRQRKGVCSTFLADRVGDSLPVPVFISPNNGFRLPTDGATPVIMIGPGTGVAPFRAFLEDRQATASSGANWLFFGDQHRACDFLYEDEFARMTESGHLHRLDTAFSRDDTAKVYVQQRMLEQAADLYAWVADGAHIYVCGDASRMAKDVDATLHQIIREQGDMSADKATAFVQRLRAEKRYQRDVY